MGKVIPTSQDLGGINKMRYIKYLEEFWCMLITQLILFYLQSFLFSSSFSSSFFSSSCPFPLLSFFSTSFSSFFYSFLFLFLFPGLKFLLLLLFSLFDLSQWVLPCSKNHFIEFCHHFHLWGYIWFLNGQMSFIDNTTPVDKADEHCPKAVIYKLLLLQIQLSACFVWPVS